MIRDEMVALFDRRRDGLNRHDCAALTALYTDDCLVESPMAATTLQGHDAVAQVYRALFEAFTDLTFTVDDLVIEGDKAVQIGTLRGTHTGTFMGVPPTARVMNVPVVAVCRCSDQRIAYEQRIYDFTGMLVQLGVLKARPA